MLFGVRGHVPYVAKSIFNARLVPGIRWELTDLDDEIMAPYYPIQSTVEPPSESDDCVPNICPIAKSDSSISCLEGKWEEDISDLIPIWSPDEVEYHIQGFRQVTFSGDLVGEMDILGYQYTDFYSLIEIDSMGATAVYEVIDGNHLQGNMTDNGLGYTKWLLLEDDEVPVHSTYKAGPLDGRFLCTESYFVLCSHSEEYPVRIFTRVNEFTPVSYPPAAPSKPDVKIRLRNGENPTKCLQVQEQVEGNGTHLRLSDCSHAVDEVKSWIYDVETGYIHNANNRAKCLYKKNEGWDNGNPIHLWDCEDGVEEDRTWYYEPETGYIHSNAEPDKCLYKEFEGWEDDSSIHLWDCDTGSASMKSWILDAAIDNVKNEHEILLPVIWGN